MLLTSIMVAGRSGSSFTAEIGSMKMREEIDAIRVMGLDPIEVLIFPRLLALLVAVPLLTVVADISSLLGGGLVAWVYHGMSPDAYLSRLREAIALNTFLVGLIKAPFMALLIALIASTEGFATGIHPPSFRSRLCLRGREELGGHGTAHTFAVVGWSML